MTSTHPSEAQVTLEVERVLRDLLPRGWTLELEGNPPRASARWPDLVLDVAAPGGSPAVFVGEIKREATGGQLSRALEQLRAFVEAVPNSRPLFVAPWISQRSQERLTAADVSYVDTTGNVRLTSDQPALFVTAQGATKNPWPTDKGLQSLRGSGAARALRALTDFAPPYGIRELAGRTDASAATLSRVIKLLKRDGLAERDEAGAVLDVDWSGAIRRWARDYNVLSSNDAVGYLQPRGLAYLAERLTEAHFRYALTGSMAANKLVPFAPARLAMLYTTDVGSAVDVLDLRETDSGANVMVMRPFDEVVFARMIERDGLALVNPSQLAVDLLTGPGRAPREGEELLTWMGGNVGAWRS